MKPRLWRLVVAALFSVACAPAAVPPAPPPGPAEPPPAPALDTAAIKPNIDSGRLERPEVVIPPSQPLVRAALPVRLAMVGDINLGTSTLEGGLPPDSGRSFFAAVDTLLVGDLVIGNFEGVLADSGVSLKCGAPPDTGAVAPKRRRARLRKPHPHCYAFSTPSYLAPRLAEAGFTHLNLANNHANDMGADARSASDSILRSLHLGTYGPLGHVVIDTIRRGDSVTVVGLVGFTTYPFAYDLLDIRRSAEVVDSLRRMVDVLVVTFHGGTEGAAATRTGDGPEALAGEPRGDLRRWAHAVIDAGASAVVGHGPHVLRGVEFYAGRPIFYSLGNFATYRGFNLKGPLGITAVLQLTFAGDGALLESRLVPLIQVPRKGPKPDPRRRAVTLLRQVTKLDFGPTGARIGDAGEILPPP